MTDLEDAVRGALRAQAQALRVPARPALDRDSVTIRRHRGPRVLIAAACLALVVAGVVALAERRAGDPEPAPIAPDITTPAPVTNGWVAVDAAGRGGVDIYLLRPGEDARRLEVAGSDSAGEACPAWSPDGTRLSFGRLTTFGKPELVIVPVGRDGAAGAPTVTVLDGFQALDGFDPYPCAIWAPDGRWVAFGGTGEVWVVDTQTSAIRRLPGLRPSDLEWRPGTDELAIAGDMGTTRSAITVSSPVSVYSVSTGELRQLGAVEAAHVTWSPDGSTLAYRGGEDSPDELWLVDADGANERLLVADGVEVMNGIGPVWSPTGDRIAYQRSIEPASESTEVVLVSVADGSQTVIEPPETDGPNGPVQWYPFYVTWSPDGTTLLYAAGSSQDTIGVLAVPADTPTDVTVLSDGIDPVPSYFATDFIGYRWFPIQMWGREPG